MENCPGFTQSSQPDLREFLRQKFSSAFIEIASFLCLKLFFGRFKSRASIDFNKTKVCQGSITPVQHKSKLSLGVHQEPVTALGCGPEF